MLHRNDYSEIRYDNTTGIINQIFFEKTEEMTIDEFKQEMLIFAEHCINNKAALHLINSFEMNFVITPDIQKWINNKILTKFESFAKKVAFLMPSDFFAQVSVEQTMNEEEGKNRHLDDK